MQREQHIYTHTIAQEQIVKNREFIIATRSRGEHSLLRWKTAEIPHVAAPT